MELGNFTLENYWISNSEYSPHFNCRSFRLEEWLQKVVMRNLVLKIFVHKKFCRKWSMLRNWYLLCFKPVKNGYREFFILKCIFYWDARGIWWPHCYFGGHIGTYWNEGKSFTTKLPNWRIERATGWWRLKIWIFFSLLNRKFFQAYTTISKLIEFVDWMNAVVKTDCLSEKLKGTSNSCQYLECAICVKKLRIRCTSVNVGKELFWEGEGDGVIDKK